MIGHREASSGVRPLLPLPRLADASPSDRVFQRPIDASVSAITNKRPESP